MTPVSGQANVYDMVRADQPQKGGTPLNRNTFRQTQADIRTYPIATGNSVTAGDVVDVVNALAPVTKPLGEYTEGDVVQLNENGVPVDFYVAKHDYEAALNGSGRTLLVRKLSDNNSGNDYVWNSSSFNNLSGSTIDTTLNNTYKARFDKSVQVAMATTKFYYTIGNGDTSIGTLERSIFLLSNTEIGGTQKSYLNIEGETLPIASVLKTSNVDNYSRSVVTTDAQSVMYFTASGGHGSLVANKARAARPCFTLPNTFLIDTGEKIQTGEKEITKNVVAEANVKTVLFTGSASNIATCRLNDKYSICVCGSNATGQIYLVDNASGKAVIQTAVGYSQASRLQVARLNDTKFIVTWYDGTNIQSVCGTANNTTISLGNSQYLVAISDVNSQSLVPLSETSCAVIYGTPTRLGVHVCTISGTTITRGTDKIVTQNSTSSVSATLLPDDSSGNKRVCVCFSDANDGNKGKAVIVTINSSNVVAWGSVVTFNDSTSSLISCASNGNTVVASYANNDACYCRVLAINGTSITAGSQTQFETTKIKAESSVICVGGKFVVCGHGQTSGGAVSGSHAIVLNVSGSDITVNTAYQFDPAAAFYLRACAISDSKFIIAYADNGNNNYGTATILEVNGNQIAGGFTLNSTQAIALESGEAGQEIEVIFAGTTAADFVAEGQKITSNGVYGYGPMAGWLNVIPYWAKEAGVRIATGSYVGTGKCGSSNPNTLTFKFVPKLVIVTSSSGGGILVMIAGAKNAVINQFTGDSINVLLWNETRLSWYTQNITEDYQSGTQMNQSNTEYVYVAIG